MNSNDTEQEPTHNCAAYACTDGDFVPGDDVGLHPRPRRCSCVTEASLDLISLDGGTLDEIPVEVAHGE